jgi:hypothetical protein
MRNRVTHAPASHHGPLPERPALLKLLRSRFSGANGILSVLYLALSLWIYLNPERARRIWRNLQ